MLFISGYHYLLINTLACEFLMYTFIWINLSIWVVTSEVTNLYFYFTVQEEIILSLEFRSANRQFYDNVELFFHPWFEVVLTS